jgi:hypothetical protein
MAYQWASSMPVTPKTQTAEKPAAAGQALERPVFKRVLFKLSGEALMGDQGLGIDPHVVDQVAHEIKSVTDLGVQIGIVIGGGNIFRGLSASARGMDRVQADYMGMLATVINGMALQDYLERHGVFTRLQTAIHMEEIAEPFIRRRRFATLKRGASSSSPPAPATPTSPPTPRRPCAPWRSTPRSCCVAPTAAWRASTTTTPVPTPTPRSSIP